jgi:hypothetical protein
LLNDKPFPTLFSRKSNKRKQLSPLSHSSLLFLGSPTFVPTGQRYDMPSSSTKAQQHPFVELHMLFRHDSLLVNVQEHVQLRSSSLSLDVTDKSSWLQLLPTSSLYALRLAAAGPGGAVRKFNGHPSADVCFVSSSGSSSSSSTITTSSPIDNEAVERSIEAEARSIITSLRADKGLATQFDDLLGIVLQPALVAYEMERTLGVGLLSAEASQMHRDFQNSIRSYVGSRGESFKAFPTCFSHVNLAAIRKSILAAVAAREVIGVPSAVLAVRAKVFVFPAGIVACWVMIGSRYSQLHLHVNS